MDETAAQQVAGALRRLGLRGIVSPEDLNDPDGPWRVYDSSNPATRRDITDEAFTLIRGRSCQSSPARGFVVPTVR